MNIYTKRDGKHIIIKFPNGADIQSNLKIKAKKTTSYNTKMKGIVVQYREKVNES